jgi:hypothetical protein
MVSWKDFRSRCEIESDAKQEIIRELFDWVDDKKRDIVKHEPPDKISYGELKMLDELIEKLNTL